MIFVSFFKKLKNSENYLFHDFVWKQYFLKVFSIPSYSWYLIYYKKVFVLLTDIAKELKGG